MMDGKLVVLNAFLNYGIFNLLECNTIISQRVPVLKNTIFSLSFKYPEIMFIGFHDLFYYKILQLLKNGYT